MRSILFVLLLACSPLASAGSHWGTGKVKRLYVTGTSLVYFLIHTDCKVNSSGYYYFDGSTDPGKRWYSLLVAAANSRRPVSVKLQEDCDPARHQAVSYLVQDFPPE